MRAAQATAFGDAADVLTVHENIPVPSKPSALGRDIQIKVYACSLSPSDYRMLSGDADIVKKPSSWPYIPGGDVSGTVVATGGKCRRGFQVGDAVIGTWEAFGTGGLAEYINVDETLVEHIPVVKENMATAEDSGKRMSFVDGAALVDSSVNAMLALEDAKVTATDNVLVLGGSGGVGTALVMLLRRHIQQQQQREEHDGNGNDAKGEGEEAKEAKVGVVVTTSTQKDLMTRLGASHVVDYTKEDWHESAVVRAHAPYDVVIDCAVGQATWAALQPDGKAHGLVKTAKDGGRFLAVVINDWHIEMHSVRDFVSFMWPMIKRTVSSRMYGKQVPSYWMLWPAPRGDSLKRLLRIVEQGKLDVVVDERGPHAFTTDGLRQAFDIMVKRKGHGKVVIRIRDEHDGDGGEGNEEEKEED